MYKTIVEKFKEVLSSVLPIAVCVLLLHFTIAPMARGTLALFLAGVVLLIVGMTVFMLGADMSMLPMGEMVGSQLTKSKKIWMFIVFGFIIGFVVTIAEPDLQVLAKQVPAVPDMTLIVAVGIGVGLFLILGLLRIIFQINLSRLLIIAYISLFVFAMFTAKEFLPVAFDAGGVTTGPITVPFILALGVGVSAVRGSKSSSEDSFGLVALSSIGPILAVMILGLVYGASSGSYEAFESEAVHSIADVVLAFFKELPTFLSEVLFALLPMGIIFAVFQVLFLKLRKKQLIKIIVGLGYTYIGLVLFLIGVNVGFLPAGKALGAAIAQLPYNWILIPIGMVMGFCVVAAEPAVHVLNKEVEDVSGGSITRRSMLMAMSIGVSVSIGIAMLRVLTGINILYFLIPGYVIALGLTFVVPKVFTAIAFDSGGVASGAMSATFLLPFAMGACEALGGNVLTDAFGLVALVAMTPLIMIQLLGLIYKYKTKRADDEGEEKSLPESAEEEFIDLSDVENNIPLEEVGNGR